MNTPRRNWMLTLTLAWVLGSSAALFARNTDSSTSATEQGPLTNPAILEDVGPGGTNSSHSAPNAEERGAERQPRVSRGARHGGGDVVFGHSVEVKPDETVQEVVVFGGSVSVKGKVRGDVVVFGGSLKVEGEVGGDAVVFGGGAKIHTNAVVKGDLVTFGGTAEVPNRDAVRGDIVPFGIGHWGWEMPRWLESWLKQCVFKLRPLAPQVGWVWVFAGAFFLLYLLIAAAFPRPVRACVEELTRRPATTFLMGLLTKLLAPVVFLILLMTGLGLFIIPFIWAVLFLGAIFGKVALLEWLGFKLGRLFGPEAAQKPLLALLLGTALVTLLYMVWVVGLLTFAILSVWGLGIAVTAAFGGLHRELPEKPLVPPAGPVPPAADSTNVFRAENPPAGGSAGQGSAPSQAAAATAVPPTLPLRVPEALSFPRAGFWERLGAGFLDIVLVSLLGCFAHASPLAILGGTAPGLVVALAYFAGMWAWKGTTVGGIILRLKVVRLDGQPVTFPVALVRALAAAFSVVVLFLGFIWIAWDPEKQGWHDKIAGTAVIRLPRGTPLLCL